MMDINFFSVYDIDSGQYNFKKSTNHSTVVIPYTVCNFQRVNCHFIHVCMYIVAVGLYTLILYMSHAAILLQSKLIIPFLTIKRIFFCNCYNTYMPTAWWFKNYSFKKLVVSFTSFNRHTTCIYIHNN